MKSMASLVAMAALWTMAQLACIAVAPHPGWTNALRPAGKPGPQLTLARQGTARYTLLLPAQPTTQEQKAADDLAQWLAEMTGATFPIVHEAAGVKPPSRVISLGKTALLAASKLPVLTQSLGTEGYAIAVRGGHLFLLGGTVRGPINAVYALLEEDLGCRWYARGTATIPARPTLAVRPVPRTFVPVLEIRDPFYWDAFEGTWSLRNRTNAPSAKIPEEFGGHIDYAMFVHTFNALVPPDKYFAEHPEYFSMVNGVRTKRQLCMTHPEVLALTIAGVKDTLNKRPTAEIMSVSQNDDRGYCECPNCKAISDAEGGPSGPLLQFVNAVAEAIEADFPQVKISTLAYHDTFMPPKTIRPHTNVVIQLCTDSHAWPEPFLAIPATEKFQTAMKAWQAIGATTHIWDYTVNFSHYVAPMPNMPIVTPDIRFFIEHGARGVMLQGNYQSPGTADGPLKCWVWAKQLWNPALDTKALVRDFCYGYFGTAAEPMYRYQELQWQTWERHYATTMTHPEGGIRFSPTAPYLTGDFLSQATALFAQAEKRAADEETKRRVALAKLPILYVRLCQGPTLPDADGAYRQALDEFTRIAEREKITTIKEGAPDVPQHLLRWSILAGRAKIKIETPGTLFADGGDFGLATYLREKAPVLLADPLAENGYAVRQPGNNTEWSINWRFPIDRLVPGKSYQVRIRLRADKTGEDGKAFHAGVWDWGNKVGGPSKQFLAKDVTTQYQWYVIGTFVPGPNQSVYVAPDINEAHIPAVYTERIELVPVEEGR